MPYYDTQKAGDHGVLQFVGTDQHNNEVFSVGMETAAEPVIKALGNLVSIANRDIGEVTFVNTMPAVNLWMKIGGVSSRALGLKGFGRPLVVYGTLRAYENIAQLVTDVLADKGAKY
jgi:hypothetical protein